MVNTFVAIGIWLKTRAKEDTCVDLTDSTKTDTSNTHPTDLLDTSGKAQERVLAWVSNDPQQLNKCSLSDLKQSLDTSHENHHFGARRAIGTLSGSINGPDSILVGGSKGEEEKGRNAVEVIRKEQLIDEFERLWQAINEIKDSIRKTPEELNKIGPCELSKRSKIPVRQEIKR